MGNLDNHNFDGAEEAVLPREGEHTATIIDSEVGETKNKEGTIVRLDYCLLDEPNGRQDVSEWVVIRHKSKVAENLGRAKMAKICKVLGVANPKDTQELHNRKLIIKIKHKEMDSGSMFCRVVGHLPAPTSAAVDAPKPPEPKHSEIPF